MVMGQAETVRETVDSMEENFLKDAVYVHCKKVQLYFAVKDALNEIIGNLDGKIYDFYIDYFQGSAVYSMLNDTNRKKYISQKYDRGEKEKISNSFIGKALFAVGGNVGFSEKVDYLLISNDDKIRKSWWALLRSKDEVKPRRLLMVPFFRLLHRAKKVDVFDELEKRGIRLKDGFRNLSITYADIHDDISLYRKHKEEGKDITDDCKRLFGDYFSARDFRNAKDILDELLTLLDKDEATEYEKQWEKLETAFKKAEQDIADNEQFVVEWIDGLRYDELKYAPRLSDKMMGGLFFTRMYTETPYTSATYKSMFSGGHFIEDKHFQYSNEILQGSKLIKSLNKQGYELIINSGKILREWIEDKDIEALMLMYHSYLDAPSSIWHYYSLLRLQEHRHSFLFVHIMSEIHSPRWCPEYPNLLNKLVLWDEELPEDIIRKQIKASISYADEQCDWYSRFYDKAKHRIIMSDHGQERYERDFTIEGLHHVIFSILGEGVKPRTVSRVHSLAEFSDLVDLVFQDDIDRIPESGTGYAFVENDDPYGARVEAIINKYDAGDQMAIEQWIQYRGIVSDNEIFVTTALGKEYCFKLSDKDGVVEEERLSEEQMSKELKELKHKVGRKFIDINKESSYKSAKKLYEHMGLKRAGDNEYV